MLVALVDVVGSDCNAVSNYVEYNGEADTRDANNFGRVNSEQPRGI